MLDKILAVMFTFNALGAVIVHNWSGALGWLTALLTLARVLKLEAIYQPPFNRGVR